MNDNQNTELSDSDKSVMLAELVGWRFELGGYSDGRGWCWVDEDGLQISGFLRDEVVKVAGITEAKLRVAPMLYEPARMALAWRVLNWADIALKGHDALELYFWWDKARVLSLLPADAQRSWLDKILGIAINAGLTRTGVRGAVPE